MKQIFVLMLTLLGIIYAADARNLSAVLDLKNAGIGGTGCVGGQADLVVVNKNALLLRTPGMQTTPTSRHLFGRRACAVAIPFTLPRNARLVVTGVKLTGDVRLARGATAITSGELFTAGTLGPRVDLHDHGPKYRKISATIDGLSTACGETGMLRLNLSQRLDAHGTMSSARIKNALLGFRLVSCK